jgi:hypothetical protein
MSKTGVSGTAGRGVSLGASGAGTRLEFDVSGNQGATAWSGLGAAAFRASGSLGAAIEGSFNLNSVTGVATEDAVLFELDGSGTAILEANDNILDAVALGRGIFASAGGGAGTMDLTFTDNAVTSMGVGAAEGVLVASGNGGGGETSTMCLNLSSNTDVTAGGAGASDFRLEQFAGTTFGLQDFVGDGTMAGAITTWVNATKVNVGSVSSAIASTFIASAGACAVPSV